MVALLAEGVDRNPSVSPATSCAASSPSSRRAWIEISIYPSLNRPAHVALLAEGVDRNRLELSDLPPRYRRPPRGGRG